MTADPRDSLDNRVLILTPTGRDGLLTQEILRRANIDSFICNDIDSLCREVDAGAGCVIAAEDALAADLRNSLADLLAQQPGWSDLPILVMTQQYADSHAATQVVENFRNVTLLERPVRMLTLVSTVRTALRARARQYELRHRFEAQGLLAAIVANSDDAIISKTLQGTILSWNASAERMFGYTASEAIGKSITLIVPPERLDEERMILGRIVRGEPLDHFETVRMSKSGKRLELSLTISPVRDTTGRIIGASKIARDISMQRMAERALREANRRKDEFLATLAHELRNPLAPIRNSLQILRLPEAADPEVAARVLNMMERQINNMVRLVDDLMEVSRISSGKVELRKEPTELTTMINGAIETCQPLLQTTGHQLTVTIAERMIIEADPLRMAQVFANLLNNAAKYTPEAGQIWIDAQRSDDTAVVSIRDTGIGIPAEMLPRVFDLFTQVDHAPDQRSRGGLGIGLTLVQSLVQMHGGTVSAMSEGPGKGSEFVVRLPLARRPRLRPAPPPAAPPALRSVRILVADDNRDSVDSLGMMLRFLGAQVEIAHDGQEALAAMNTFRPAIVILDIGMPGVDGYEVARRIRAQPQHRHVMLIALTGWGQNKDRRRSREAGFNHHLIKPISVDALEDLLTSISSVES
jgi:PAS domain S-box-containing protein